MLDMVRYMTVWFPIIFLGLHLIFQATGMDHPPLHHSHAHNATLALNGTAAALNGTAAAANGTAAAAGHATRLLLGAWG